MRKDIFAGLMVFFISCSSTPVPRQVLTPDEIKKTLFEIVQVDEYLKDLAAKDTLADIKLKRSNMYEQVFKLNKTTRKEFFSSYKFYQQHPDLHKVLFDSLQNYSKSGIMKIK